MDKSSGGAVGKTLIAACGCGRQACISRPARRDRVGMTRAVIGVETRTGQRKVQASRLCAPESDRACLRLSRFGPAWQRCLQHLEPSNEKAHQLGGCMSTPGF